MSKDTQVDFLFKTSRFNLSKVGDDFINDCCFGEDLITWLREKLLSAGYDVDEPGQEDWGWLVEVQRGSEKYNVGTSGNSDEDPARPDYGEWRVFVEPHRSLKDRLLKRTNENNLAPVIDRLLSAEVNFELVRRDE